ncbi:MAG: hypothetical protein JXL97_19850 [Bacteroidales bacterium]|nr:hypothetical protein [Bacteroidales bacterium]
MTRKLIVLAVLALTISLCFGQTDGTFKIADHYKTKEFDAAIFPADYIDLIPGQRFTPTRQEIDKAEIALQNDLKTLNKELENQSSTPIIHKNLHKYKRQYFGYIDKNGDKILLINGFWSNDKKDDNVWLSGRIEVFDGGSYYWNVKFNLNKNVLFDLDINGYA